MLVCALLTYGGVSLFVVVFAVYPFGAVIAALPGFLIIRNALMAIPDPPVNEAITVTTLADVTGSASAG